MAAAAVAADRPRQLTMMMIAMQRTKSSKPDRVGVGKEVECLEMLRDPGQGHYFAHDRGSIVGNPDSSNTSRKGRKHPRPSYLARLLQCQP